MKLYLTLAHKLLFDDVIRHNRDQMSRPSHFFHLLREPFSPNRIWEFPHFGRISPPFRAEIKRYTHKLARYRWGVVPVYPSLLTPFRRSESIRRLHSQLLMVPCVNKYE